MPPLDENTLKCFSSYFNDFFHAVFGGSWIRDRIVKDWLLPSPIGQGVDGGHDQERDSLIGLGQIQGLGQLLPQQWQDIQFHEVMG